MDFIKELFNYIMERKKWWLAPLIFILVLIGLIVVFSNSAIAPFVYSLF